MNWTWIITIMWMGVLIASFCSKSYRELWSDFSMCGGDWAEINEDNMEKYGIVGGAI